MDDVGDTMLTPYGCCATYATRLSEETHRKARSCGCIEQEASLPLLHQHPLMDGTLCPRGFHEAYLREIRLKSTARAKVRAGFNETYLTHVSNLPEIRLIIYRAGS